MRRTLLALATGAALAPAGLGLAGNASFSQSVPAPVPPSAQVIQATHHAAVPHGDDHGGTRTQTTEPGDDHGGTRTQPTEPGDDHGGTRTQPTEPGDDHGGTRTQTTEPGDDHGERSGSGGHGSDDASGHH